jgi:hypothetical protein
MAQAKLITAGQKLMQGLSTKFMGDPYIAEAAVIVPSQFRNNPGTPSWFFGPNGIDYKFEYLDVASASGAYTRCPPLAAVINRKAQAYINGVTALLNSNGKDATTPDAKRIKDLLAKPNPLQSWKRFEAEHYMYCQLYGFCIVMPIYPFGFEKMGPAYASSLWNLPSYMLSGKEITNKMWYNAQQLSDIIPYITIKYKDLNEQIPTDNLYIFKDLTLNMASVVFPDSRVKALSMPINNIIAAYESRGELINYAGSQGILTPEMDASGPFPIKQTEKDQLQADFKRQYGIKKGQSRYIISPAPAKWQPMGKATKDLMLFEEIQDDIMRICDGYVYPSPLLNSDKGPAVANTKEFKAQVYQDAIIPESLDIYEQWNAFFRLEPTVLTLAKNYDHIPVLKSDQVDDGRAQLYRNQSNLIAYQSDLITLNQWREDMGYDITPDGDVYYSQSPQKQASDAATAAALQATQQNNQNQQNETNNA